MKILIYLLVILLLTSANIFSQWYQQNSGTTVSLNSIFFIDENTGWACGDSGKVIKSINGGIDWFEQNTSTTENLKGIQFVNYNIGWAYSYNKVLNSIDGGYSWTVQDISPYHIVGLQFVNPATGWLITQIFDMTSIISRTTDGGMTLTDQNQFPDGDFEAMFFLDTNFGWITKYFEGTVIKTTNGGNNWAQHNGNISGAPMTIRFVDPMTGWISHNTLGSYTISKSTDGGDSWFVQKEESFKYIYSISFPNSEIGYAAGFQMFTPPVQNEALILKTNNGGTDWIEQYRDDGELFSIFFLNNEIGWASGRDGKILSTDNGGITTIGNDPLNPDDFNLEQNFPNPFNPVTSLQYVIGSRQFVTLKVYDLTGNEIATLVNEEKPAGKYKVEFNAKNLSSPQTQSLSSGVYFYQLIAGEFVGTKKMILLK